VELIDRMLETIVTTIFDYIPDIVQTALAFDVARGL
jgi:hypothetical protein